MWKEGKTFSASSHPSLAAYADALGPSRHADENYPIVPDVMGDTRSST